MSHRPEIDRRDFLRAGVAGSTLALTPLLRAGAAPQQKPITLIVEPNDPIASAPPAQWALGEVREALTAAGFAVSHVDAVQKVKAGETCVLACGSGSTVATTAMKRARVAIGEGPERLALMQARISDRNVLIACGSDARGLTYALLEIADRVRSSGNPLTALSVTVPIVEQPANPVRSIMRQFTSDVLDTPWLNDREMWPHYLTLLATHRFNRLHLAFGLGYDTLQGVTDSYMLFLYPFVVGVPGYNVRMTNLSDADRDRNLEMLRYISEQTVARGLVFQLGIWMHGYQLLNSPKARYVVEGLTPETHAAYCRDALTTVLRACPAISSVTLRIHGESGIAEGSYDFWKTIFDGVPRAGRTVEIDLHAKGLDQKMIDQALATGMPVNVAPKYWAEHLGMPYHQTAIRDLEMPATGQVGRGLMTLSEGQLSYTRYGYADFLRDDRKYTVRHRIFAGTQRLLMSGDPEWTRAYSRAFSFCGSAGVDVMEPLTCRGRRGTGVPGSQRSGYADAALDTKWDWQKFAYWYRVWGCLTYNPDADSAQWRRQFTAHDNAPALMSSLATASRILPIVTTAHLPSAACDAYWPEAYWNQPIVGEPRPNPYGDTPAPKTFQYVSPLDPQLFSTISECADEVLNNQSSGKYSPIEVAGWLDDLAVSVARDLSGVKASTPEGRRLAIDIQIQANLGRFFAAKFRAGVLYALYERIGAAEVRAAAIASYQLARDAWVALDERATVYAPDLSVSDKISERGQWRDRLAAIDDDIGRMTRDLPESKNGRSAAGLVKRVLQTSRRQPPPCTHTSQHQFTPGAPVPLELTITRGHSVGTVVCRYRHVNQAERFHRVEMTRNAGGTYTTEIPGAVTDSPFPLQYYFVVGEHSPVAHLYPGLGPELTAFPYFVLTRRSSSSG